MRIDTTKSGKKYGKCIPGLQWLYDYVNHCYINTHEIFLVLLSIGRKDYIVDFVLIKKSRRIGWDKLSEKSIKRLLKSLGPQAKAFKHLCRVSLDGAFGHGRMLKFLSEAGFHYTALKSGGKDLVQYQGNILTLKELDYELSVNGEFKKFNPKHNLEGDYCSGIAHLVSWNLPVKVLLRRFRRKKKQGYHYLMLISVNTDIYDYQIAQCYGYRWRIEECIKDCKGLVGLMSYSHHTKGSTRNIECFLALRMMGYMLVSWCRVEHCRPSRTSFLAVAKGLEHEISGLSYNAVWSTFFPIARE